MQRPRTPTSYRVYAGTEPVHAACYSQNRPGRHRLYAPKAWGTERCSACRKRRWAALVLPTVNLLLCGVDLDTPLADSLDIRVIRAVRVQYCIWMTPALGSRARVGVVSAVNSFHRFIDLIVCFGIITELQIVGHFQSSHEMSFVYCIM